MKSLKALTLGLLAAASIGTLASAQVTTVHVAGSTAFRAPTTAAIIDYLSSTNNPNGGVVYAAWDGTSTNLLGSNGAILANGTIGSGGTATIIIETYWTGSAAGVIDLVAGNNSGTYLDPSSLPSADLTTFNGESGATLASSSPYGGGTGLTSTVKTSTVAASGTVSAPPDLAMSDSNQNTVALELSTATLTSPLGGYSTASALAAAITSTAGNIVPAGTVGDVTNGFVGVVPFEWVIGNGASAATGVSNITQQAARAVIAGGKIAQALLTGGNTTADVTNQFYLTGRNEDSGTRLDSFEEAQFGVTANPKQYSLPAFTLFPANSTLNTEPTIKWTPSGHSGYATGGNVASALGNAETAPKFAIGYLGISDAATATKTGSGNDNGTALTYNGVAYSVAAVQDGSYTLWGYEHAYELAANANNGSSTTTLGSIINAIADGIYNTDADINGSGLHAQSNSPGILYSTLNVSRTASVEGQPVTHN